MTELFTETVEQMQRTLCQQVCHSIRTWTGMMPADMEAEYRGAHERADGLRHSIIVELEGMGGLPPHALSAQADPGLDFYSEDWSFRHSFPADSDARQHLSAGAIHFIDAAQELLKRIPEEIEADLPRQAIVATHGRELLALIEQTCVLRPLACNEETGAVEGVGPDLAPGLVAVFDRVFAERCIGIVFEMHPGSYARGLRLRQAAWLAGLMATVRENAATT